MSGPGFGLKHGVPWHRGQNTRTPMVVNSNNLINVAETYSFTTFGFPVGIAGSVCHWFGRYFRLRAVSHGLLSGRSLIKCPLRSKYRVDWNV